MIKSASKPDGPWWKLAGDRINRGQHGFIQRLENLASKSPLDEMEPFRSIKHSIGPEFTYNFCACVLTRGGLLWNMTFPCSSNKQDVPFSGLPHCYPVAFQRPHPEGATGRRKEAGDRRQKTVTRPGRTGRVPSRRSQPREGGKGGGPGRQEDSGKALRVAEMGRKWTTRT